MRVTAGELTLSALGVLRMRGGHERIQRVAERGDQQVRLIGRAPARSATAAAWRCRPCHPGDVVDHLVGGLVGGGGREIDVDGDARGDQQTRQCNLQRQYASH